jgi:tetratricopeptide (TPR) repeat protein
MKRTPTLLVCAALSLTTVFLTTVRAGAEDPIAKRRAEARVRFDRGVALADEGDTDRAIAEFQKAYELLPNPRVLLNIAKLQAAAGRSTDALASLDKLGSDASPEDQAAAKALRDLEEAKVGSLQVITNFPGCRVEVDNISVATTPLDGPLRVGSGQRIVAVYLAGHAPMRKTVTVAGRSAAELKFELVPLEARLSHLALKTNLPGAELRANGEPVGVTPFPTTLTFAPGKYHLELVRPGYVTAQTDVSLGEGATGEVRLDPLLDEQALRGHGATLELAPSEPQASVSIDGRALGVAAKVRLPAGLHDVVVEKAGFARFERTIALADGKDTKLSAYLVPTADTRDKYESSARTWHWLGYGLTGTGAAAMITGGVLTLVFEGKRSDAQKEYDAFVGKSKGPGTCDDVCLAEFDVVTKKRDDAASTRNVGLITLGAGAALLTGGIVTLLLSDDPHKYDHPPKSAANWLRVRPILGTSFAGLAGTF